MEAICSSETSVETQQTTRRHIPEDDTLQESAVFLFMRLECCGLASSCDNLPVAFSYAACGFYAARCELRF
jgi:hypothetical protein